ncbi:MAG: helix-turn-helix domain-containing protein [Oscillospiraceae bacterium]|jgi:transcriptional regulator with XRE-family HTH domain|nr:helix-turn-helix domain-containing protein [Oscillospiraceae bacterium]
MILSYTRLKDLRIDSDKKQRQIAEMLHVNQRTYSRYEMGQRQIPIDSLKKLADFYDTSIDYLLYRTDLKKPYPESKKLKLLQELE